MDYDKLIERLKSAAGGPEGIKMCHDAALAIKALRAENAEMEKQLGEFSEFLCHMTGNLLSKTNYTSQAMISAAEDYQQRVCDSDCELRADLARVTAERDAAVKDLKKWNICATCGHYSPYGKKSNCKLKSAHISGGNWAGCSEWEWRGNEKVGLAYGTCSHCHREAWANYELTPRCPYCGAHMDGVKS